MEARTQSAVSDAEDESAEASTTVSWRLSTYCDRSASSDVLRSPYVVRVAPWPRMARSTRFRISGTL